MTRHEATLRAKDQQTVVQTLRDTESTPARNNPIWWHDLGLRQKGWGLVAVPAIALLVGLLSSIHLENNVVETSRLLDHSLRVRTSARHILNSALERESAVRAYVITGDKRYLEDLSATSQSLLAAAEALTHLVSDNDSHSDRMSVIEVQSKYYLENLDAIISLRDSPHYQAEQLNNLMVRGRQLMAILKVQLQALLDEEAKLAMKRAEEANRLHQLQQYVAGSMLVMGLLGCVAISFLFRGIAFRVKELVQNTERLGHGKPLQQLPPSKDELGGLALSLEKTEVLLQQRDQAIHESEMRLRGIVDHSPALIYIKDMDGRFIMINRDWSGLFGLSPSDILGKRDYEVWPAHIAAQYRENDFKVIQSGQPMQFEETTLENDGEHHYFSVKFLLRHPNGIPFALCGISTDVTARKKAEEQARVDKERLEFALGGAGMGAWHWELGEGGATMSSRAREIMGYPAQGDISMEETAKIILPEDLEAMLAALRESVRNHTPFSSEYRIIHGKSRDLRWIASKGLAYYDSDGKPIRVEGIVWDITDRKNTEAILAQSRDLATSANRAKSEFLSRMSHELRTPLNSVLGFAQLLQLENLGPSNAENVRHIIKGGKHLLHLIDEVLDISRIEVGNLSLSLEPVLLGELLNESIDFLRPLAARQSITLLCEVADDDPPCVLADRQRLKQVLINLISNAIKYNRDGGQVRATVSSIGHQTFRVEVTDTGIGISPALQKRLFTPFDRLGAEQSNVEGTGLGLALSNRLLIAMNSSLHLKSAVGKGSTFFFDLPRTEEQVHKPKTQGLSVHPDSPDGHNSRILYIEDNISNVRLMERILASQRPGVQLTNATQGHKGYELAKRDKPNLVLLDMNLPDAHGSEIITLLRRDRDTEGIPVVVVSADATSAQIDRLLAMGANAYISKPYEISEFLHIIDKFTKEPVQQS
ncbi:PAS domain-containing protein [Candidatus Sumerlaeota bacterium]|nr:PAS domain-containing protein [Candidatus Sumerlaeota bacterium]